MARWFPQGQSQFSPIFLCHHSTGTHLKRTLVDFDFSPLILKSDYCQPEERKSNTETTFRHGTQYICSYNCHSQSHNLNHYCKSSIMDRLKSIPPHDDVMIWKFFLHYCAFGMGIQWLLVDSPHKGTVMLSLGVSFVVSRNKLLNKKPSGQWFDFDTHVMPLQSQFQFIPSLQKPEPTSNL